LKLLAAAAIAALIATAVSPGGGHDATARTAPRTPPEQRTALRPGLQLAAMRTGIAAAPGFFSGFDSGCTKTVPVIAYVQGSVLAGNFRDDAGGCYVWLNLGRSPLLTAQEICKLSLHEMGHLTGLRHSQDPGDIMYSPFRPGPVPEPCGAALAPSATATRAPG
jgi:hypothetical protein